MCTLKEIEKIFDEECNKIHAESINDFKVKNPPLYHYTNYEGLIGILSSRILRQTHSRYLNDPTELYYGQNIILEFLKNFDSTPNRNMKNAMEGFLKAVFNKKISVYMACLCLSKYKLALWRHYANNGTGFAICFKDFFKNAGQSGSTLNNTEIGQVLYGKEAAFDICNRFSHPHQEAIKLCVENKIQEDEFRKIIDSKLLSKLLNLSIYFKDSSFYEENEIRLIRSEGFADISGNRKYFDDNDRIFVPYSVGNIPFVKKVSGYKPIIAGLKLDHSDISEIIIGPRCEFIEAKTQISKILSNNGYDINSIEIEQADIPIHNI